MSLEQPDLRLDKRLAAALGPKGEALLAWFRAKLRPGYGFTSERIGPPMKRGLLDVFARRKPAAPRLSRMVSKFGGVPYLEAGTSWPAVRGERLAFLGQLNFGDLIAGFAPLPARGVLTCFLAPPSDWGHGKAGPLVTQWWPDADEQRAAPIDSNPPDCAGRFEALMQFKPAWSVPCDDGWRAAIDSADDDGLWELVLDWTGTIETSQGLDDHVHELHGHASYGLIESYPELLRNHTPLLRFTFDNAADFAWGSNVIHALVPIADLSDGNLGQIRSVFCNS